MKMKWDDGCLTTTSDGTVMYINDEGTSAWSKVATVETVGDVVVKGRSLNDTVIKVDDLESRLGNLECATANIEMEQVNHLNDALYAIEVSTKELERSFRDLKESFYNLDYHINNYIKPTINENRVDIRDLRGRVRYLDCRMNDCLREIDKIKESATKKKGSVRFLDFPDYFEKMNFKNRATRLDKMELNYIMKGTM